MQLFEAGERGVEVCLVEDFATGRSDRLRQSEPGSFATRHRSLQSTSHVAHWVTTAPNPPEPMHRLDPNNEVWCEVPDVAARVSDIVLDSNLGSPPAIDSHEVPRPESSCRLNRGVTLGNNRPRVCEARLPRRRGSGRRAPRRQRRDHRSRTRTRATIWFSASISKRRRESQTLLNRTSPPQTQ